MAEFSSYARKLKSLETAVDFRSGIEPEIYVYGISLGTYRAVFGSGKTEVDLINIKDSEWRFIIKTRRWDKYKGDLIENQSVAELFVDWCITDGVQAVKCTQKMFGVKVDGIVSGALLDKLNGKDSESVFRKIKFSRQSYYRKLADSDISLRPMLRENLERVEKFCYA